MAKLFGSCALPLLVLALLLAGCGGSDSNSSTVATGSTSSSNGTSTGDSPDGGSGSHDSSSAGGEASIENFGSAAGGSTKAEILGAFHGYLNAVATHDAAGACSYLSSIVQDSMSQLVAPRLKSKGCTAILPALLSPTAATIARDQARGEITRVRVQGDRGFVVFHAPGASLYQLTMVREKGAWKAATVAASILVPSPAMLGFGK